VQTFQDAEPFEPSVNPGRLATPNLSCDLPDPPVEWVRGPQIRRGSLESDAA
jgi:hypothetical protein